MQPSQVRPNDSRYVLLNLVILLCRALLFSQNLVITEIYRNPSGAETALCGGAGHEFIEIVNFGTDTFFTRNLFITDGMEADTVIPFGTAIAGHDSCITDQTFLAPGQIGLILDSDYKAAVEEQGCGLPVKSGTVLFRCTDGELGNGLADDDGVILYKGTRSRIDSIVCYLSDNPPQSEVPVSGKVVFSGPGNREGYSVTVTGFLTGNPSCAVSPNPVSPGWLEQVRNGWIVEWVFSPHIPSQSSIACTLACMYMNDTGAADGYSWFLKKNGLPDGQGKLTLKNKRARLVLSLQFDSVDYRFSIGNTEWTIDLSSFLLPNSPLKINEIYPLGSQSETEWIELVNVSSMPVNLKNWMSGNFEDTAVMTGSDFLLDPGRFVVIAKSKELLLRAYPGIGPVIQALSWHTLNNSGDTICIFDNKGNLREMVCYRYSWFDRRKGVIERVNFTGKGCDSANWALSSRGGTPGYPNDAVFWRKSDNLQIEIGPVPFTPDNDGKDDLLSIKMSIADYKSIKLCIYDFKGKTVRTFDGPVQKQYFWDGKTDSGKAVQTGPFFVVAELNSSRGVTFLRKKGILWR